MTAIVSTIVYMLLSQIMDENKRLAEATYMKKKMYYNMRIKTIERTFSTLTRLIEKAQKIKTDGIN